MSKDRARARAEREADAARRAAAENARREQQAAQRARRAQRELTWRRYRLWTHGPSFARNREKWAAILIAVLMVLLLAYLFTGSFAAVLMVGLVATIAGPAMYALVFDRRSR